MIRSAQLVLTLALTFSANLVLAQGWGTADGSNPVNPTSGLSPFPIFCYDRDDGILYLDNAGSNGVDDTQGSSMVGGDDWGFTGLRLSASSDIVGSPDILPPFADGIAWTSPVFFNDTITLSGNAIGGGPGFLSINENPVPIVRLVPGLSESDFIAGGSSFIHIEVLGTFDGGPGIVLFSQGDPLATGAFKIVPEPNALALITFATFAACGRLRRA